MVLERPQDARLSPWVAVLTMWIDGVISVCIVKTLGMILPTLQVQFRVNAWIIGFMVSMVAAMGSLIGPFAVLFKQCFGVGVSIIMCGALIGTAGVAASFATSAYQLAGILILLAGTGMGVSSVLTKEWVAQSFQENYSTAIGIARTGSSVGFFVSSFLAQLFLNTYGWRGVLLLTGGISFHLTVCGFLIVATKHRYKYKPLNRNDDAGPPSSSPEDSCKPRSFVMWNYVCINLKLELLLDLHYSLVSAVYSMTLLVWSLWTIYFVSLATSNGFTTKEAALFVSVGAVGSLFVKVLQGFYIDQILILHRESFQCLHVVMICICACTFYLTPIATSYWGMMTSSFVYLTADGVLVCMNDTLLKETIDVDKLVGAYGWIALQAGVLKLTFGFVPGVIYDASGSYGTAFMLIGGLHIFSLLAVTTLHFSTNDKGAK
ncbi:monocarboxylate transporter 12-like [Asterias amurensis]|uniref:monocarboxylate transporter 12-like n=1 Tax=Asterias amurensis TaxID=7602 RepID=UPI003AB74B6F